MKLFHAAFFVLALLCSAAEAQHDHGGMQMPSATITTKDNQGRTVRTAVRPGDTAENARLYGLPLGNGASPDGAAWLRPDVTGVYRIVNASINRDASGAPRELVAGQIYRIAPHIGPLVWVTPAGKQEPVPDINLIAIKPSDRSNYLASRPKR